MQFIHLWTTGLKSLKFNMLNKYYVKILTTFRFCFTFGTVFDYIS